MRGDEAVRAVARLITTDEGRRFVLSNLDGESRHRLGMLLLTKDDVISIVCSLDLTPNDRHRLRRACYTSYDAFIDDPLNPQGPRLNVTLLSGAQLNLFLDGLRNLPLHDRRRLEWERNRRDLE